MARADTNFARLAYAVEASYGQTPAGVAMTEVRHTGEGLERLKDTVVSNEVRDDRMIADLVEVGVGVTGPLNFELLFGEYEDFFEGALASAISSGAITGTNILAIAASSIRASTGLLAAGGFAKGQYIKVKASAAANANAVAKIASVVGGSTLQITGTTLAVETPGASHSLVHRTLRNGTTKSKSFVMERQNLDIGQYQWFNGLQVGGFTLNVPSRQIVTGVFEFMGKDSDAASTTVASGTLTSPTTNDIMAAGTNIAAVLEGGGEFATGIRNLTLRVSQNLRDQPEIRRKQKVGHGFGAFNITGTMEVYFENRALLDKFLDHTQSSVTLRFRDGDNNDFLLTIPALRYSRGNAPINGVNNDALLVVEFTAIADSVTNSMIQIDMLPG